MCTSLCTWHNETSVLLVWCTYHYVRDTTRPQCCWCNVPITMYVTQRDLSVADVMCLSLCTWHNETSVLLVWCAYITMYVTQWDLSVAGVMCLSHLRDTTRPQCCWCDVPITIYVTQRDLSVAGVMCLSLCTWQNKPFASRSRTVAYTHKTCQTHRMPTSPN